QHARILRHGHDHLADGFRLGRVAQLDIVYSGHAVDDHAYLWAEAAFHLVQRVRRTLDGVVQQRSDQGRGVHAEVGDDGGDGQQVGDVRVAGQPELSRVQSFRRLVRPL